MRFESDRIRRIDRVAAALNVTRQPDCNEKTKNPTLSCQGGGRILSDLLTN